MKGNLSERVTKNRYRGAITVWTCLAALCLFVPLSAQQQGPMKSPAGTPAPPSDSNPLAGPPAQTAPQKGAPAAASTEPPSIPIEQIIQRFAAREAEFKTERDNYTYTQTFVIQTLDGGRVDGEYRMTSEIVFTPEGKRYERVTNAPTPTLERITLSQQDLDDLEHEPLDELNTYVFDVGPKTLEKNQRYFQGRVWVDDKDFEIVKTDGKAVPDIRKH